MFKSNSQENEKLDKVGREVLRAAAANEEVAEAAASTPFLFVRIRSAIADEQRRREESGNWLSLIFVARRAVPAMAMITLLVAVLTVWSGYFGGPATGSNFDEEALLGTPGVEQTVLANAGNLSQDDVVNIIVDRDYGRNSK